MLAMEARTSDRTSPNWTMDSTLCLGHLAECLVSVTALTELPSVSALYWPVQSKKKTTDSRRRSRTCHNLSPDPLWDCLFVDMIKRRHLRTRAIKMFVLDEADEMLNKGS